MSQTPQIPKQLNSVLQQYLPQLMQAKDNKVGDAIAGSLAGMDTKSIASKLPTSDYSFLKPDAAINSVIGSVTNEAKQVATKAMDNMNNVISGIAQNPSDALNQALVFVTNTSKESVQGLSLPDILAPFNLDELSKNTIGRLQEFTNTLINSPASFTNALGSIYNEFQSGLNTAIQYANDIITSPLTLLDSTINSVISPVQNLMGDALSFIPDSLKDITTQLPGMDLGTQFNNIINSLPGIPGIEEAAAAILSHYKEYPNITSNDGIVTSLANNTGQYSLGDITKLQKKATEFCPDIPALDSLIDFTNLKNIFDTLVELLAKNGLTDLLNALLECGEQMYNDNRTFDILANNINKAAKTGNTELVTTIATYAGLARIEDPKNILNITASNVGLTDSVPGYDMWYSLPGDTNAEKMERLTKLSQILMVDLKELFAVDIGQDTSSGTNHILSAPKITVSMDNNKYLTETILNNTVQQTAVALLATYGQISKNNYVAYA